MGMFFVVKLAVHLQYYDIASDKKNIIKTMSLWMNSVVANELFKNSKTAIQPMLESCLTTNKIF